jgi:hypothetical protein
LSRSSVEIPLCTRNPYRVASSVSTALSNTLIDSSGQNVNRWQ